jgi:hypothetical protein
MVSDYLSVGQKWDLPFALVAERSVNVCHAAVIWRPAIVMFPAWSKFNDEPRGEDSRVTTQNANSSCS